MFIRSLGILIILILMGIAVFYIANMYRVEKAKHQEDKNSEFTVLKAIEKSRVRYLEIRKQWIDYSLGSTPAYYATAMNDMTIPEIARFQKLMVTMNETYNDLTGDVSLDTAFAVRTTALSEAYERAILIAKNESL
ncbi:MAG: hypothetical protein H9W81_02465 [Enterococcus sp.]|nr:hypothetical protein [Enterococcus sp.]